VIDLANVLDHATRELGIGTRPGMDATRKLPGEGFQRPWPALIRMSEDVRGTWTRRAASRNGKTARTGRLGTQLRQRLLPPKPKWPQRTTYGAPSAVVGAPAGTHRYPVASVGCRAKRKRKPPPACCGPRNASIWGARRNNSTRLVRAGAVLNLLSKWP
jgi:hypothetical protein